LIFAVRIGLLDILGIDVLATSSGDLPRRPVADVPADPKDVGIEIRDVTADVATDTPAVRALPATTEIVAAAKGGAPARKTSVGSRPKQRPQARRSRRTQARQPKQPLSRTRGGGKVSASGSSARAGLRRSGQRHGSK
jgi:hypothetical protein